MTVETNESGDRLIFAEPVTFTVTGQTETIECRVSPRAFELTASSTDDPDELGQWHVQLNVEMTRTPAAGIDRQPVTTSLGANTTVLDLEPNEWLLTQIATETLDGFVIPCLDCAGTGEVWQELDEDDGYTDRCETCHGGGQVTIGQLRRSQIQERAISVATIAAELDVAPRTVHGWVERYPDFPEPVLDNRLGRFYDLKQVKTWHAEKQPKAGRPPAN